MKTIKELNLRYMGNKQEIGYKQALKEVIKFILIRIKTLKSKQKEVNTELELYGLECMIVELEKLKARIEG